MLADRVGCALSTVEKIERGLRRPSHQIARRIAEELRIPPEEQAAFVEWARIAPEEREAPVTTAPATPEGEGRPKISPGNLPAPATALIGREGELDETRMLLRGPEVRLLTLLGPPGIGKTRLSLALAESLVEDYAEGVWFVPLASIIDPDLVASTIAKTLGLKEGPTEAAGEGLQAYLHERQMLLMLDNFEQVIPAAPLVSELLAASPGVKLLVTSRAALDIYGEHQYDVPPLDLPDLANLPSDGDLQSYPAVALFVKRAQAVAPRFTITEENGASIAEICARLDGLPLAIELAAARSRLFDPVSILRRLDRRLPLLSVGPRDRTPRQQSLRGAIDWSHDLLNDVEKALYRRMSVFVGGCTLEAIEAVAWGVGRNRPGGYQGPDPAFPAEEVESLANKSLVQRQATGEMLFSMLETLREYASERLVESGEEADTRRKHAEYFLALAEEAEPLLRGTEQKLWLDRLDREHDNLRAAMGWAFEKGQAEVAQRIAGAIWRFWSIRGYFTEGRAWMARVLETWPQYTSWRVKAGLGAGGLAQSQGDYATARSYLKESLEGARQLGDKLRAAMALNNIAIIDRQQGNSEAARSALLEAVEVQQELGDWWSLAAGYTNLGLVVSDMGDYAEARVFHERSLALFRDIGDKRNSAFALVNLGEVAYIQGDYEQARVMWEECAQTFRDVGEKQALVQTLINMGMLARDGGKVTEGYTFLDEALALGMQIGKRKLVAEALYYVGSFGILDGQIERAVRLFAAADRLLCELGAVFAPNVQREREQFEERARGVLGDNVRFDALWREGAEMLTEEAVRYAREVPRSISGANI